MKHLYAVFAFFMLLILFSTNVLGQQTTILDKNLQVRNFKYEQGVYIPEHGTKGMMFSFEYNYKSDSRYIIPFVNNFQIFKNGMLTFEDTTSILPLRANQWKKARRFIPYREINVPEGVHEDLVFEYNVKDLIEHKDTIKITQLPRYAITIEIKGGSVKKRLKNWDKGKDREEWAPDPYWEITTGEGEFPIRSGKPNTNSHLLKKETIQFHILKGEKLYWHFKEEDGANDESLGTYELIEADGDFKKTFFGKMFDDIKGLEFTFSQRELLKQPITLYVQTDYRHNNRKGVRIDADYDLARAYEGERAKARMVFQDADGKVIKVPYMYYLEDTKEMGKQMTLDIRGKYSYFVPFYAWNSNIKQIDFALETETQQEAVGAPFIFLSPVVFDKYMEYASFEVDDEFKYKGATGVRLKMNYSVKEIHEYSNLEINFLSENGEKKLSFDLYDILKTQHLSENIFPVDTIPIQIRRPNAIDSFEFFIPYLDMPASVVRVEMDMVPDMRIPLVHKNSPKINLERAVEDASFARQGDGRSLFKDGDYGYVVELKTKIPTFFKGRCQFEVKVLQNGVDFMGWRVVSDILSKDTMTFLKDTGSIFVVVPHRRLSAKDEINITCLVKTEKGNIMSPLERFEWTAPDVLHNYMVDVQLKKVKFAEEWAPNPEDSLQEPFGWRYMLLAGSDTRLNKSLKYNMKGKDLKGSFERSIFVHREDRIVAKIGHKNPDVKDEVFIWSGDLGKLKQSKYKGVTFDIQPVDRAIIKAKVQKTKKEKIE